MLRHFVVLFLLIPNTTFGATIYIDGTLNSDCTSGSYSIANRDCNGTDGSAYNDVQAALTASGENDTINVRSGVITSNVSSSNGIKPKKGQTWQTYPADLGVGRATIRGGSSYRAVFWSAYGINDVTIQNLIIIGANEFCIYSCNGDNLTLNNLDASGWNIGDQEWKHGLYVATIKGGPNYANASITNNYVHDPANHSGHAGGIVIVNDNNINNIVEHNTVENTYNGIWLDVRASATIRYNLVRNVSAKCYHIEAESTWVLTHNICNGAGSEGALLRAGGTFDSFTTNHNTFYDFATGLWIIDSGGYKLTNSKFENNIFMANTSNYLIQVANKIHLEASNTYKNNLLYSQNQNDNGVCWGDENGTKIRTCHVDATRYPDTAEGIAQFNSDVNTASGNITGDPIFKDAANGDFNLVAGSPAINAASDGKDIGAFNQPTVSNIDVRGNKVTITWDIEFTPIQNCDSSKFTVTADDIEVSVNSCSDINDSQTELTLASNINPNQEVELTGAYGCAEDSEGIGSYGLNGKARVFSRTVQIHAENPTLGVPQNFRLVSGNSP